MTGASQRGMSRFEKTTRKFIQPGTVLDRRLSMALIPLRATLALFIGIMRWTNERSRPAFV